VLLDRVAGILVVCDLVVMVVVADVAAISDLAMV
jgi:hypothetical protein